MLSLFFLMSVGCSYDEQLPQANISGTVVIPREAATRTVLDPITGEASERTDSRFIGPIYLGAFPNVTDLDYGYSHPEMGPVIQSDIEGNTYPYGGGSIGRFDFACFEYLACRTPTGRFSDYDDLLGFFKDVVGDPVQDAFGNQVVSAGYMQAVCYDLFEITADYEMEWISDVDDYQGEKLDRLDFTENSDGDFEAPFDLWRVNYAPGMQIWGWMDAPTDLDFGVNNQRYKFGTCNENNGQQNSEYNNDFVYGVTQIDLLNFPGRYIGGGDWVVGLDDVVTVEADNAEDYRADPPEITVRIASKVE